ncbi:hypothetical protein ACFLXZ_01670 [Chloroflexota bacterium]
MAELPKLIQALLDPKGYPEPPKGIELVQTQMSFILLADDYVYKIKKPVNLGYLDYTSLEKRHFYCHQEVELNRRLCPDTYLGVVPVTHHQGQTMIAGKGEALEYAVKMRRLPPEAMLDVLLTKNKVSAQMITVVGGKLAEFHRKAEANATISTFGSLDSIRGNAEENFTQTEKYTGQTITWSQHQHIKAYTEGFIRENAALFQKRVARNRIRDCHGDLHAAHICFSNGICIYDCIEFNNRFRYCDVASEIAFLAMDLDRYGHSDLSRHFVATYIEKSQDEELKALLGFYKCYRAYVRGKVGCFKFDDPYITREERETVLADAKSYFKLAESYISQGE